MIYDKQMARIAAWFAVGLAATGALFVLTLAFDVSLAFTWPLLVVSYAAQVALWTGRGIWRPWHRKKRLTAPSKLDRSEAVR